MGPDVLPLITVEIRKGDSGFTGKALSKRRSFRGGLITVLGESKSPGAAEALRAVLHEDAWTTARRKAAFYLGERRDPQSVPGLIDALRKDGAEDVREEVRGALRKCVGKDLGPNPDVWDAWWKEHAGA